MKIEKQSSEILNIRKTVSNKFLIINDKNETMEIDIVTYFQDDEISGYDNEETLYDENEKEINWSDIETFLGETGDIDELREKIDELIKTNE